MANLKYLAQCLESVRKAIGEIPVVVINAYSIPSNEEESHESMGFSAVIKVNGMTSKEVCDKIDDSKIRYDQLIENYQNTSDQVYISFATSFFQKRTLFND